MLNYKILMRVIILLLAIPVLIAINIYFDYKPETQQAPIQVTQPAQDQ